MSSSRSKNKSSEQAKKENQEKLDREMNDIRQQRQQKFREEKLNVALQRLKKLSAEDLPHAIPSKVYTDKTFETAVRDDKVDNALKNLLASIQKIRNQFNVPLIEINKLLASANVSFSDDRVKVFIQRIDNIIKEIHQFLDHAYEAKHLRDYKNIWDEAATIFERAKALPSELIDDLEKNNGMAGPSLAHLKHSIEPMSSDLIGTSGSTGIFDTDVSDSMDRTDVDTDIGAFHLMEELSQQSTSAGRKDKKRTSYFSGLRWFQSSVLPSRSTRQHFSEQAVDRGESYFDNQLPAEVIEKIILFLSPMEIYNLSATNRFFRSLLKSNEFSERLYKHYFSRISYERSNNELLELQNELKELNQKLEAHPQNKKLKVEIAAYEKKIDQFWSNMLQNALFMKFETKDKWKKIPQLMHFNDAILGNDLRKIQTLLKRKDMGENLAKQLVASNFLFYFLGDAIGLKHQSILDYIYKNPPSKPELEKWVWAVVCNQPIDIIKKLMGNNLDLLDKNGLTAMHYVVLTGNQDLLDQLIAAGANIEKPIKPGLFLKSMEKSQNPNPSLHWSNSTEPPYTPLHLAVVMRFPGMVKSLIDAGAYSATSQSTNGPSNTPLVLAIIDRQTEIIDLFLQTPRVKVDANAFMALDEMVSRGEHDFLREFLDKLSPSQRLDYLNTYNPIAHSFFGHAHRALHIACKNGDHAMIEFLLKYGADVNLRVHDPEANTPLYLYLTSGKKLDATTINLLLAYGANPSMSVNIEHGKITTDILGGNPSYKPINCFDLAISSNNQWLANLLINGSQYPIQIFERSRFKPNKTETMILEAEKNQHVVSRRNPSGP